jgi:hypothetical protein
VKGPALDQSVLKAIKSVSQKTTWTCTAQLALAENQHQILGKQWIYQGSDVLILLTMLTLLTVLPLFLCNAPWLPRLPSTWARMLSFYLRKNRSHPSAGTLPGKQLQQWLVADRWEIVPFRNLFQNVPMFHSVYFLKKRLHRCSPLFTVAVPWPWHWGGGLYKPAAAHCPRWSSVRPWHAESRSRPR